ncbi:sulfatase-like hydrolase/transferase [Cellulophaga sp. F20128]|uniref:sulfatase-like hydrolase/transferase n=1 Tax=Cellulophaga sp. F20128 TaxID=2926413 RepID=UPI001FF66CD4|nr:sulfatase-like hydrolase/transferase [Cellulophaga sp. F20128]MCK0156465.1 sulfatase-like hydrolase/transferase [Cellulophaga sp. F20128]
MKLTITRRFQPLLYVRLLIVSLFFLGVSCKETPKKNTIVKHTTKPNVLIILTDQWRAQATGYAGDPNAVTPNLDNLASESINFKNAISGTPVCTPFRAALLTGQLPLTTGIFMNDLQLNPNALTMAEIFAEQDYNTGYIGKWHLDGHGRLQNVPEGPRRQGFQFWNGNECTHDYNHSVYYDNDDPNRKIWENYDTFDQTDAALHFIKEHKTADNPYLMVLSYGTPHGPYHTAPEAYRNRFDPEKIQLRQNVPDNLKEKAKKDLAGYYAHIAALDDMIGKIKKELKENGQWDNTIVLFTSDHGDLLGSHGELKKQQPYDESIGVPFLLKLPSNADIKPSIKQTVINSEDILPTLLGLTSIAIPNTIEGTDFSALITNNEDIENAGLIRSIQPFGSWNRGRGGREYRGLKTPRFTYARDLKGPWLLFDNQEDPYQENNLIGNEKYTSVQATLDKQLDQKLKANNDQFLPGPEYIKKWGYTVDKTGTIPYTH